MTVMILSQIAGSIVGMEIWKALLEETNDATGESTYSDIPYLQPNTPAYW